jgi:poly(3-hydroxybutyrate) depolymerase
MTAAQNKRIKDYPKSGWQDESSIGRWTGFRTFCGTYKVIPGEDHALKFLTYVPERMTNEPCPLLISWHGGGFVSSSAKHTWT